MRNFKIDSSIKKSIEKGDEDLMGRSVFIFCIILLVSVTLISLGSAQVTYISSVGAATNTVVLPAHQAGDLLIAFAFRDGSTTAPNLSSGWTSRNTRTTTSTSAILATLYAMNSSTPNPVFGGATEVIVMVYRNTFYVSSSNNAAVSSMLNFSSGSFQNLLNPWIVYFAGHRSASNVEQAPQGSVNRISIGTEIAGHDTNGSVLEWVSKNVSVSTSSGWVTFSVHVTSSNYSGNGSGTLNNPYEITNCFQLQEMSQFLSSHFILKNDINCTNTSTWSNGSGFSSIGVFSGSLNGSDKTILNLRTGSGLFSQTSYANITRLELLNSTALDGSILVHYASGGYITRVHTSGVALGSGGNAKGGIVGWGDDYVVISDCSSSVSIPQGYAVGGIIGNSQRAKVYNCFATGNITGDFAGGVVGFTAFLSELYRSFSIGNAVGRDYQGSVIGRAYFNTGHLPTWGSIYYSGSPGDPYATFTNESSFNFRSHPVFSLWNSSYWSWPEGQLPTLRRYVILLKSPSEGSKFFIPHDVDQINISLNFSLDGWGKNLLSNIWFSDGVSNYTYSSPMNYSAGPGIHNIRVYANMSNNDLTYQDFSFSVERVPFFNMVRVSPTRENIFAYPNRSSVFSANVSCLDSSCYNLNVSLDSRMSIDCFDFKLVDYSSETSASSSYWMGYRFQVNLPINLTHLIGGGSATNYLGGIYRANGNMPLELLGNVTFPSAIRRQERALTTPILLVPGQDYILAQGRESSSGGSWRLNTISVPTLQSDTPAIINWQPSNGNSLGWYVYGGNTQILNLTPSSTSYSNRPDMGFKSVPASEINFIGGTNKTYNLNLTSGENLILNWSLNLSEGIYNLDLNAVYSDSIVVGKVSYPFLLEVSSDPLRIHSSNLSQNSFSDMNLNLNFSCISQGALDSNLNLSIFIWKDGQVYYSNNSFYGDSEANFSTYLTFSEDGFYDYNCFVNDTIYNIQKWSDVTNKSFMIDTANPRINYSFGTPEDNVDLFSQNWIFVNTSLIESNLANITFSLYRGATLVNSTKYYSNLSTSINWTNLADHINYSYFVNVTDLAGNKNSTALRRLTLDFIGPNATIVIPQNRIIIVNTTQNFTARINDTATGISNVTLNIYNQTDLYNQTFLANYSSPGTLNVTVSTIVNLFGGLYTWFYRMFDFAGHETVSQNYTLSSGSNLYFCGNITQSGIYVLQNDITNYAGPCFTISANNVILDGNGFIIDGDDSGTDSGVYASGRTNLTIQNFRNITDFTYGIYFSSVSNSLINNLIATSNPSRGIWLESSSNNNLTSLTTNSQSMGIYLWSSSNNILTNINADSNNNVGIQLQGSSNNLLTNITSNLNQAGIQSFASSNNIFSDLNLKSNSQYGFQLQESSNNTLTNLTTNSSLYGIYSYDSQYNNVSNAIITGGQYSVYSDCSGPVCSSNNSFSNSNFSGASVQDVYIRKGSSITGCNNNPGLSSFLDLGSNLCGSWPFYGTWNYWNNYCESPTGAQYCSDFNSSTACSYADNNNGGYYCSWSNCYGEAISNSYSCNYITNETDCGSVSNSCTWNPDYCYNSFSYCSDLTSETTCGLASGCSWTGSVCSASLSSMNTCSSFSDSNSCGQTNGVCSWVYDETCTNSFSSCSDLGLNACGLTSGCTWNGDNSVCEGTADSTDCAQFSNQVDGGNICTTETNSLCYYTAPYCNLTSGSLNYCSDLVGYDACGLDSACTWNWGTSVCTSYPSNSDCSQFSGQNDNGFSCGETSGMCSWSSPYCADNYGIPFCSSATSEGSCSSIGCTWNADTFCGYQYGGYSSYGAPYAYLGYSYSGNEACANIYEESVCNQDTFGKCFWGYSSYYNTYLCMPNGTTFSGSCSDVSQQYCNSETSSACRWITTAIVSSGNNFFDVFYDKNKEVVEAGSSLTRQWSCSFNTTDQGGIAVSNATVAVYNSTNGNSLGNLTSNYLGLASSIILTEYTNIGGVRISGAGGAYNIFGSRLGLASNNTVLSLDILFAPLIFHLTLRDLTPPYFFNTFTTPDNLDDLDPDLNVSIYSSPIDDWVNISTVILQYYNGSDWQNSTMIQSGQSYNANITLIPTEYNYTYRVWANDTYGNANVSQSYSLPSFWDCTWTTTPLFLGAFIGFDKSASIDPITLVNTGDPQFADNNCTLNFKLNYNFAYPRVSFDNLPKKPSNTYRIPAKTNRTISINVTYLSDLIEENLVITAEETSQISESIYKNSTATIITSAGGPYLYQQLVTMPSTLYLTPGEFSLNAYLKNLAGDDSINNTAHNVYFNWSLPDDFLVSAGNLFNYYDNISDSELLDQSLNISFVESNLNNLEQKTYTVSISSFGYSNISGELAPIQHYGNRTLLTNSVNLTFLCYPLSDGVLVPSCGSLDGDYVESNTTITIVVGGEGGSSGGGGGGGRGSGKQEVSEAQFELVSGDISEFKLPIKNKYPEALVDVRVTVSGINSEFITITPTLIPRIAGNSEDFVTVKITAPAYFREGNYSLKFKIEGFVESNLTRSPYIESKLVTLYILDISRENATALVSQAELMLQEMKEKGLFTKDLEVMLSNINNLFNSTSFSKLVVQFNELKLNYDSAIESLDLLEQLRQDIAEAEANGINVFESKKLMLLAEQAMKRGAFVQALERLKESRLTYAIETKGEFSFYHYVKNNPLQTLAILVGASLLGYGGAIATRYQILKRRLKLLKQEQVLLLGLMKIVQRECFELAHMSIDEYSSAMFQYEDRLQQSVELEVKTQTQIAHLGRFHGKKKALLEEKDRLFDLVRKMQTKYLIKGEIETRIYNNMMKSYSRRLTEVEEELVYLEAQDFLKKRGQRL